jgi:hypothetical protein
LMFSRYPDLTVGCEVKNLHVELIADPTIAASSATVRLTAFTAPPPCASRCATSISPTSIAGPCTHAPSPRSSDYTSSSMMTHAWQECWCCAPLSASSAGTPAMTYVQSVLLWSW